LYDQTFTSVNASSNGDLQFLTTVTDYTNACLPYPTFSYSILPHWDDLLLTSGGIYTLVEGTAPNRVLDIEWRGAYFSGGGTVDFEVRLHENTGTFEVIYGTVTQSGSSATVGVQRGDASTYTQYECNTGGLSAGQMLTFSPPVCSTPTPTTVPPTNTATRTNTAVPSSTLTATPTICVFNLEDVHQADWFYDYVTEDYAEGLELAAPDAHPLDQPVPGPAGRVPPDWEDRLH
jgi:hypothetical protein